MLRVISWHKKALTAISNSQRKNGKFRGYHRLLSISTPLLLASILPCNVTNGKLAETCFLFKFFPIFNREASGFCRVDGFVCESEACQQHGQQDEQQFLRQLPNVQDVPHRIPFFSVFSFCVCATVGRCQAATADRKSVV